MTLAIKRTWEPHPAQRAVMDDGHRYRIVACGRRWGKSEMAAHITFEYAWEHAGSSVWWVAPTYTDAYNYGWGDDPEAVGLVDIIPDKLIAQNGKRRSDPRSITLINGSVISFRSAEREDSLKGAGISFLVIDESGKVPNRAWEEELRPTLFDSEAPMLAIGTPKGSNWFRTWHARSDSDPDIMSWQASTYQNPHISDDEIERSRQDMPERVFEQEVLAKFLEDAGGVFIGVRDCLADYDLDAPGKPKEATFEPPYSIGVDLGRQKNFAVVTALDTTGRLAAFRRLRDTSWKVIQGAIEDVADHRSPCVVRLDAGRDNQIIENIERGGYSIERVHFGGGNNKRDLIDNLAVRIETNDVEFPGTYSEESERLEPDIPELLNELQIYEFEATRTGRITYGPPQGAHDDIVDSLAMAAKSITSRSAGTWR